MLFPDKKYDGQFQNPKTEQIFDFKTVLASGNPFNLITQQVAYYPPADQQDCLGIFIPGLGQVAAESCKRSRRYADRLQTGIANLNNASFLKKNPIFESVNPYLDWIDAAIHRFGLSDSPVIENVSTLILSAIKHHQVLNLSGDSHGTILLGRGLKRARKKFIRSDQLLNHISTKSERILKWQELTHQLINILTFGNGYHHWVLGPKYIMVYIEGDPLPEKLGITPQKITRQDLQFIPFSPLFPPGSFEAHNMMFTIELLRQTFIKNHLEVGDFVGLYHKLNQDLLDLATLADVSWPEDLPNYTWQPDSLKSILKS